MSEPLIHIGYHKTGTTWLQRQVFPEAKTGFRLVAGPQEMWDLVRISPFESMSEALDTLRLPFRDGIKEALDEGLAPVLSAERISGNPHRGGRDAKDNADQLYEAFPEARILIVIREQASMIESLYSTYVRMGGVASFEEYVFSPPGRAEPPLFWFEFLEYHRLISYYQRLFGAERVLVLPYELLDARPRVFVKKLAHFSGAKGLKHPRVQRVNSSPSAAILSVKRRINRLFVHNGFNPSPPLPVRIHNLPLRQLTSRLDNKLPETLKEVSDRRMRAFSDEVVGERYKQSNALTVSLTGLDLSEFGYPC